MIWQVWRGEADSKATYPVFSAGDAEVPNFRPKLPRACATPFPCVCSRPIQRAGGHMRIIAGAHKGRVLKTVSGPGYRPAMGRVRESLFSRLESRGVVWGECRVLDLFAGSGSLAFEALSRGATEAVLVEKDSGAAACLSKNAATLGVEDRCRILVDDVLKITARTPSSPFQVIFIDPPYGESLFAPTLRNIIRRNWLDEDGFLIAEVEKTLRLNAEKQPGLEVVNDTLYGQTRVIVWTAYHD